MRIISDFKDYYDSVLGFGSDPNLNYARKQELFEFEKRWNDGRKDRMPRQLDKVLRVPLELVARLPYSIVQRIDRDTTKWLEVPITTKLIGFCGFLYPAIEIDKRTFHSTDQIAAGLPDAYLSQFHLDREVLDEILAQKYPDPRRWYWWSYCPSSPLTHNTWKKAAADIVGKRFDDVFIQLGIPVFKVEYVAANKRNEHNSIDKFRCTLNPYLKAEQFQKVKGPTEAFQEISMYLGNELARQREPISTISDEIMRDKKGFDKWSFRRHKEEDRKYRKRKQNEHEG